MVQVIGREPEGLSLFEARERIINDFKPWLDPEIRFLVGRCLSPSPEYRPTLEDLVARLSKRLAANPWSPLRPGDDTLQNFRNMFINNI